MPVLINRDSGLAEDLGTDVAQSAVQSGTHDLPLIDPDGNHVLAPFEDAANLMQQGYTQPKPEQLKRLIEHAVFNSTEQQVKAFTEGAASGATFGLSTAAERLSDVATPEDINRRREYNPGIHGLGQAAGLTASMLTGVGEGALIARGASALVPRVATSALGRIGSTAARMAAENAMFTAGDEASKMFAGDPHQSLETAAADIGMSGLIGMVAGGALKGTGELWEMGPGRKLGDMMKAIANKSQGLPSELKLASGIELAPEMEAALSSSPEARQAFQTLQESSTKSGVQAQESLNKFYTDVDGAITSTIGKTPEDIASVASSSKAEVGKSFQDSLSKAVEAKVKPISEQYERFAEKFKSAEISPTQKVSLANDIAAMIAEQGLDKGPNEAGLKLAQKAIAQLQHQNTAQDLRAYAQGLYEVAPYGSEMYQTGRALRKIFNSGMESTLENKMAAQSPHLVEQYRNVNAEYSKFRDLLSEMNDRLRLGREGKAGAEGFVSALKSADPESVASRLSLKGDVNLQSVLEQQFPEIAGLARSHELNNIVRASLNKSGEGLDPKKFFKNFNKLEPELRNYLLPQEGVARIGALEHLVNQVPTRMNPSGTAKTLDALWSKIPESAAGLVAMLTGHNPIGAYVLGKAAHYIGREVPDAVRLALLKYMGSSGQISAQGLKAAAAVASQTIKGERSLTKAALSVFDDVGAQVIPHPSSEKIDKLKDTLDKVAANPEKLGTDDNRIGHYLPDHAVALGMISSRAVSYLASLRPSTAPAAPLDPERKPSKMEEQAYRQALIIAEQPLTVLKSIKEGSLTPQDIQHLQQLYPQLAVRMRDKLTTAMVEAKSEQRTIPYKTKMSMSLFLAQPLESSLQPANIMAAQPPPPMPQKPMTATSSNKIMKLPKTYETPNQSREMNRISKH